MSESVGEQLSPGISRMDLSSSSSEEELEQQQQRQRHSARQKLVAEADNNNEYVEVGEVKGDNNKGRDNEVLPNIKNLNITGIALNAQSLHPFTKESTEAQSTYSGYLKQIDDDKIPEPGTKEHKELFAALMVEYFYEYFRETNAFTQEQNNLVDSTEVLAKKIMFKFKQVCGYDIEKDYLQSLVDDPPSDILDTLAIKPNIAVALLRHCRKYATNRYSTGQACKNILQVTKNIPFPYGCKLSEELERKIKVSGANDAILDHLMDMPNSFVVLLLNFYICLQEEDLLGFAASKRGIGLERGIHLYKIGCCTMPQLSLHGQNNFISMGRVLGFAHAVINNYWKIIVDKGTTFKRRDGTTVNGGLEYAKSKDCTNCHLLCFTTEVMGTYRDESGAVREILADLCLALGHSTLGDRTLNKENESCLGTLNIILPSKLSSSRKEERFLISACRCVELGANFGRNRCIFITDVNLDGRNMLAREVNGEPVTLIGNVVSLEATRRRNEEISNTVTKFGYRTSTAEEAAATATTTTAASARPSSAISSSANLRINPSTTCMIVLDFETTNLLNTGQQARIIQAACLTPKSDYDKQSLQDRAFNRLFYPGEDTIMPESAYKIHGLSMDNLLGCIDSAEGILQLLAKLKKMKGARPNLVLIGHKIAEFDIPVLLAEMRRCNIPTTELTSVVTHYIDTLELARMDDVWGAYGKKPKPSTFNLEGLYLHLFGEKIKGAHNALCDVKACLAVLLELDPTLLYAAQCMKPITNLIPV